MFQKRFGRALVITTIVALALPLMSLAAVHTDKADYAPGSVVTISGDNTNFLEGLGYQAGESVQVDVQGPNGYLSSCSGLVADDGTWSCQVTLWDSLDAVGSYTFSATGQTSGTTEAGSFTDAININSFAADCTTDDDSFPTGTTVCAKATGLPGGGGGSSGKSYRKGLKASPVAVLTGDRGEGRTFPSPLVPRTPIPLPSHAAGGVGLRSKLISAT